MNLKQQNQGTNCTADARSNSMRGTSDRRSSCESSLHSRGGLGGGSSRWDDRLTNKQTGRLLQGATVSPMFRDTAASQVCGMDHCGGADISHHIRKGSGAHLASYPKETRGKIWGYRGDEYEVCQTVHSDDNNPGDGSSKFQ